METVDEEHGDGHGAYSSRHWRDPAGDFRHAVVVNVALEFAAGQAVDANVNHDSSRFDPVPLDEVMDARRGNDDIARSCQFGGVARFRVHAQDRGSRMREQSRRRSADEHAAAQNPGQTATDFDPSRTNECHDAKGRARVGRWEVPVQHALIIRRQPVDILAGRDRLDCFESIDLRRHRKLRQDAIHVWIGVELSNETQNFTLGGCRREAPRARFDTDFRAGFLFVSDVDVTGRVVSDQNHGKKWPPASNGHVSGNARSNVTPRCVADLIAIDDLCRHELGSNRWLRMWQGPT